MIPKSQLPAVVQSLINSYATLVMKGTRTLESVPETYTILGNTYPLRDYVEIEIAERTIAIIG